MKVCTKCKVEKGLGEFHKNKKGKYGLKSKCKSCVHGYYKENFENIAGRVHEYRKENAERIAEYSRNYRKANPEKIAEYLKANAEKIAYRVRVYRNANAEKIADSILAYKKSNPEKRQAINRNRRAREFSAEGKHTAADVLAIFEKQQGLCANCQTKLFKSGKQKYHVDHIMPLALGGSNWPSNLQCLCPFCNLSKGAKHPDDWAAENGRLI